LDFLVNICDAERCFLQLFYELVKYTPQVEENAQIKVSPRDLKYEVRAGQLCVADVKWLAS
jgi:hypothetical protein